METSTEKLENKSARHFFIDFVVKLGCNGIYRDTGRGKTLLARRKRFLHFFKNETNTLVINTCYNHVEDLAVNSLHFSCYFNSTGEEEDAVMASWMAGGYSRSPHSPR